MGFQLRCLLVLLVQTSMVFWEAAACNEVVSEAFAKYNVAPDVVDEVPCYTLDLVFSSGAEATYGNELTPTQVQEEPSVTCGAPEHPEYSTLIFSDPDYAEGPEFLHWLVVNIPMSDLSKGEVLAEFIRSGPAKDSGLHRYTFTAYTQPGKLDFDETRLSNDSVDGRASFSTKAFVEKYNLGSPLAGNFYRAAYDTSVDQLYIDMGLA